MQAGTNNTNRANYWITKAERKVNNKANRRRNKEANRRIR